MTAKHDNVWAAFAAAQNEFKAPAQSGVNPHFRSKYSTLADIFNATMPALHNYGLIFTQRMIADGSTTLLVSEIMLPGCDYTIKSSVPLTIDQNPQKFGSLLSYYKRYSAAAMLAVVDGMDDDDGSMAAAGHTPQPARKPQPKPEQEVEYKSPEPQTYDGTLTPDDIDLLDSWLNVPASAQAWAVSVGACENEYEARASMGKIVKAQFGDTLNKQNVHAVLSAYLLHQREKLSAKEA